MNDDILHYSLLLFYLLSLLAVDVGRISLER